jgi:hypothetical protein
VVILVSFFSRRGDRDRKGDANGSRGSSLGPLRVSSQESAECGAASFEPRRTKGLVVGVCLVALGVATLARSAQAAPRDALAKIGLEAARKAYTSGKQAAAEKKLLETLKLCEKSTNDCSPKVKAEILRDLGIVLAEGKKEPEAAQKRFAEAIALDATTTLPSALSTPLVLKAWEAAKAPTPAASSSAPAAPPPPPPPPPPEPKPLRRVPTTNAQFQRGVGLIMESREPVKVSPGGAGPGPIVAPPPAVTNPWLKQFAFGYAKTRFVPTSRGLDLCDGLDSHVIDADMEFDRHVPGTLVGHRLRLPLKFGFGATTPDGQCGTVEKGPNVAGLAFFYGLDFHAPLPGVLHGLSAGPYIGPEARLIAIKQPTSVDAGTSDTSLNLAARAGVHGRFRYGHPQTGFNAYLDGAYFRRQGLVAGTYVGVYQRFELKLAYKSVGLLGYLETRLSSGGDDKDFENLAQAIAQSASLYDIKGIALVLN